MLHEREITRCAQIVAINVCRQTPRNNGDGCVNNVEEVNDFKGMRLDAHDGQKCPDKASSRDAVT